MAKDWSLVIKTRIRIRLLAIAYAFLKQKLADVEVNSLLKKTRRQGSILLITLHSVPLR